MKKTFAFIAVTVIIIIQFSFKQGSLKITSPNFLENGLIPVQFTCDGDNYSPGLQIETLPTGVKSLAIIVHDPDAPMKGGFTHWVAYNIDPVNTIPEGFKEGEQGLNGKQEGGYTGPCPPSGTHHYHFKIYALDIKLPVDKSTDKEMLEKEMAGHIIQEGEMVGMYKKTAISKK
jgi:Raf kinase inhibitor-like YbhB/YbcL family protein